MSEQENQLLSEKIDFCQSIEAKLFKNPLKVTFSRNIELKGEIFGKNKDGNLFIIFVDRNVFFLSSEMVLAGCIDLIQKG